MYSTDSLRFGADVEMAGVPRAIHPASFLGSSMVWAWPKPVVEASRSWTSVYGLVPCLLKALFRLRDNCGLHAERRLYPFAGVTCEDFVLQAFEESAPLF